MSRDPDSETPWVPRADVFLNLDGEFTIKVELASMRREDLELVIEGYKLRITGRRPNPDLAASGCQYLATGIDWGFFNLVVDVPPRFDLARAMAVYQNGLLRVRIPPNRLEAWQVAKEAGQPCRTLPTSSAVMAPGCLI